MPAVPRAARRVTGWLAGLACLAASASGCASMDASNSAAAPATAAAVTAGSGCATALNAVSKYGPTVVRDHNTLEKVLDDAEIELLVLALDAAADATGNPTKAQSIRNLASAYQKYRDAKGGEVASVTESILADTDRLDAVCGA